ncbi:MAG TPA: hypothetical protein DEG76_02945 [Pseudohongiella sp.]|nr:hypothetical protein [Pseudohongiella sp.]HBX36307.1 hypothetical protein [Pseudohongiella sp.]|tara:strand:+ start:1135 stop:1347 length:213 start_codon:yes stop_codon:yes gene_type:complete
MGNKAEKRPAVRKIPKQANQAKKRDAQTVWTPAMDNKAKSIAADKQKSVAFLKRAGILNEQGQLAKEYAD